MALIVTLFDPMRNTGENFLYEDEGDFNIVSFSSTKIVLENTIDGGRFDGETQRIKWLGSSINLNQQDGEVSAWQSVVNGKIHYELEFDPPLDFSDIGTAFQSTVLDGLIFTGNKYANEMIGDAADDLLIGKNGNDLLKGLLGHDTLQGGNGNDTARGGDGKDEINGGAGKDGLIGGNGKDTMNGGDGNDTLNGGKAKDLLTGGDGDDCFEFNNIKDSGTQADKRDTIKDFDEDDDKIDLSGIDARTDKNGNQKFSFIDDDAFSEKSGELRYKNDVLRGDVDGDGKADFAIKVADVDLMADHLIL